MNEKYIQDILSKVADGEIDSSKGYEMLKDLPYKDMGFAKLDIHRQIRTGYPEVVYCQGKTSKQIRDIFLELSKHGKVMGTRATEEDYRMVKEAVEDAIYYPEGRIIYVRGQEEQETEDRPKVVVVSAGTADMPVSEEAAVTAEILGNEVIRVYDVGVAGIHRLLDKLEIIRQGDVVIAVAGMEGALASVVGGLVETPVIAVPTSIGYGANFQGLSALLCMLNSCANGVATVNIDNGFGAAYMASVINRRK